jgi:hypothetical protein
MSSENQTVDTVLRQKYFLVSKRGTMIFVLLALVAYGAAVLWSEFVFSVSRPSLVGQIKQAAIQKKSGCPSIDLGLQKFQVPDTLLPDARKPYFFDKNYRSGYYDDSLGETPGCIAALIGWYEGVERGSKIYFFDRKTNKATVKVTIESVK